MYLYLFNILHVISNVCGEEHASGRSRKPHGENRIHRSFLFSSQRCNHILTTMQTFFYSKNIIPIRSNKFKTFLICNQALRVPTEICDSNNISVCIKSRVDKLFKFLCSSAALKLLLLKSLLLLLSLPNLYKCFSFAQPDIPPHVLCLSYSIYSLIASSCIEGNLQKMERQWQRKGTNRTDRVRGGHYWVQTNVTVWRQRNLVGESKGFNTGL